MENSVVERLQASDCRIPKDSDTGVSEDDHNEYGSITNSAILSK